MASCFMAALVFLTPGANCEVGDASSISTLQEYCFRCHGSEKAKADVNLKALTTSDAIGVGFKTWELVLEMLEAGEMPPEDEAQPTNEERVRLSDDIEAALRRVQMESEGDPGIVELRRLTRAEYAYSIEDLTGLRLEFGHILPEDAAGGEGFANFGAAQFLHGGGLERYLEAAKMVAARAVIGAGSLRFYSDPGMTGQELSAIHRIRDIYREWGFRSGSGEGGEAFGLDKYPRAFYVGWRFLHRDALTLHDVELRELAHQEGIPERFAQSIWAVLTDEDPSFPTSEITNAWRALPPPSALDSEDRESVIRRDCEEIYETLLGWQSAFANASNDDEEAPSLNLSALLGRSDSPRARSWTPGIREFARRLPQLSHREPAPSDRDPIPAPFDNRYNTAERNLFHYRIKYHRDDHYLYDHILDDAARKQLDAAWVDLLTSFDYFTVYLQFIADKYGIEWGELESALRSPDAALSQAPDSVQPIVRRLSRDYLKARETLESAQNDHWAQLIEFSEKAWRRPLVSDEDVALRQYYVSLRSSLGKDHRSALRATLARVLVSPNFIYRLEKSDSGVEVAPLNDWELASRLSYFLWSSGPDDELRGLAENGALTNPETLTRQARRMLRDPKARRFAAEFFGQWFGVYRFDQYNGIDTSRFAEFTPELKASMNKEAIALFEHIVRADRPVSEVLFADYGFLNQELAEHYGIPNIDFAEDEWRRVEGLRQYQRGGLLRLGATLTVTSAPLRTSPVKRGDWILRRIVDDPVPPPPPDAGSIPADDVLSDGLTLRQRLEAHRQDEACIRCHERMDPYGFALESYGPIGRWRESYRDGQPVDARAVLKSGAVVEGPDELIERLKTREHEFVQTFCEKLLGYALGRTEAVSDGSLIADMMGPPDGAGSRRVSEIVERLVSSRQFRFRRNQTVESSLESDPLANED